LDAWKSFEAVSAKLFGETRCWANSGERLDFPPKSDTEATVLGQCKNVKVISGNEITKLAEEVGGLADAYPNKIGVVCFKIRRGRGQPSASIVAMTFEQFEKLRNNPTILEEIRKRTNA
jgi:hypothetical protein